MNLKNSLFKINELLSFNKILNVPTSKSHANRALILAAVYGNGFKVHSLSDSTDVINLLSAFKKIGLRFTQDNDSVIFHNSFPACESETSVEEITLQTGDGGTTNRFLLALLSRGTKTYHLYPSEKLAHRPIDDLLNPLKKLQVKVTTQNSNEQLPWVSLQGPATMVVTSVVNIDCSKSTQFASAMMLAFCNLPLTINCINVQASETYIEMTKRGIKWAQQDNEYTVPADFSSLSYPIALAALKGEVLVQNTLSLDIYQADSVLVKLLEELGAEVSWNKSGLSVKNKGALKAFSFVVKDAPDLFPTLVFLASHIDGVSEFRELDVLKYKESDRLAEMKKVMDAFDVLYEYNEELDSLKIHGKMRKSEFVSYNPPRDHRIVMSVALFMALSRGGELTEVSAVEKSYPQFFKLLN